MTYKDFSTMSDTLKYSDSKITKKIFRLTWFLLIGSPFGYMFDNGRVGS